MTQVTKTPLKISLSALLLLVVFLFKGITYLSPRLLHYVSGNYEMWMAAESENTKEKAVESSIEGKEFTDNLYADLCASLKYPLQSSHFPIPIQSFTREIYLPIITPPPRGFSS